MAAADEEYARKQKELEDLERQEKYMVDVLN